MEDRHLDMPVHLLGISDANETCKNRDSSKILTLENYISHLSRILRIWIGPKMQQTASSIHQWVAMVDGWRVSWWVIKLGEGR